MKWIALLNGWPHESTEGLNGIKRWQKEPSVSFLLLFLLLLRASDLNRNLYSPGCSLSGLQTISLAFLGLQLAESRS